MRRTRAALLFTAALALCALAPQAFGQAFAGWVITASASGAAATATKASNSNRQYVILSVSASCATTPSGPILLQLKDGSTVIWENYVTVAQSFTFPSGIAIAPGDAASAVLASCGSNVVGKVNFTGVSN